MFGLSCRMIPPGDRVEKCACVLVSGIVENLGGSADFEQSPGLHDADDVADLANNRQIVGNEEIGQAQFSLQLVEERQNLRLHRDIESGDGFVENEQIGRANV